MRLPLINNLVEEKNKEKLQKFYENKLIPAEKKNFLTRLGDSQGPYLGVEGENGETHYMMDAASQIATLGLGFSPQAFMGTAHFLESWTNDSKSEKFRKLKMAYTRFLKRKTNWKHLDMTICNSGAEAAEIALGYCYKRRKNKKARKVLAFEGSFHGRMVVSLSSTWNKVKREPFSWEGFDTTYCPVPSTKDSQINVEFPDGWRNFWDLAVKKEIQIPDSFLNDPLTKKEMNSLLKVRDELLTGDIFAIITEPMQCEGGDRYLTDRWHTALLLMARSFGVEVVHDEVQTGFHLGRDFFWHKTLDLRNTNDGQLSPDYVICAKKAQTGLVLSPHHLRRRGIERKEYFQVASVIRGYHQGLTLDQSRSKILNIEKIVGKRLKKLIDDFSEHLEFPRLNGMAFAFDLKNKELVSSYIAKRFTHGLLYYPAGEKTLRFRVNTSFVKEDINFLFERLHAISSELFKGKVSAPPTHVETIDRQVGRTYRWHELMLSLKTKILHEEAIDWTVINKTVANLFKEEFDLTLTTIDKTNIEKFLPEIERLEKEAYEPVRQTSLQTFKNAIFGGHQTSLAVLKNNKIAAMTFASPLADYPLERGLRQDPSFNDPKSLYVMDTTVSKNYRGLSIGRQLKYALSIRAMEKGYKKINGRNRDQLASSMLSVNLSLGAYELFYLKEDYPDDNPNRDVIYYSTDLSFKKSQFHLSRAHHSPLGEGDLDTQYIKKNLPFINNKICLSNFVSENYLNNFKEIIKQLPQQLQHAFSTSGQSECVDKLAKSIWVSRKKGPHCLTFEGHYFGNGSFLSRSLSSSSSPFFPVQHLPHPREDNYKEVLNLVEKELKEKDHLAVWIEPLPQNILERVPYEFLKKLKILGENYQTPIIYNETSSSQFSYSSEYYFLSEDKEISPNAGMCFFTGQAGMVFLEENLYFDKPLMMISTWDGDEISLASYHRNFTIIKNDIKSYKDLIKEFSESLKEVISRYPVEEFSIENGVGYIKGILPYSLQRLLKNEGDRYLVDPSRSSMKNFIEEFK